MITSFLHECDAAQQRLGLSRRALLAGLPRSTIQRWRSRRGLVPSSCKSPAQRNRTRLIGPRCSPPSKTCLM
ncbi:MAG TPA: hypothetical protein VFJ52_13805, partial [Terriglobia bacterium]|nr:hypothetical protein [Terriglobia bacterium]